MIPFGGDLDNNHTCQGSLEWAEGSAAVVGERIELSPPWVFQGGLQLRTCWHRRRRSTRYHICGLPCSARACAMLVTKSLSHGDGGLKALSYWQFLFIFSPLHRGTPLCPFLSVLFSVSLSCAHSSFLGTMSLKSAVGSSNKDIYVLLD